MCWIPDFSGLGRPLTGFFAAQAVAVNRETAEKKTRAPPAKGFLVTLAPHAAFETRPDAAARRDEGKSNRRAEKKEG
jgi:hypothetical protein